MFKLLFSSI